MKLQFIQQQMMDISSENYETILRDISKEKRNGGLIGLFGIVLCIIILFLQQDIKGVLFYIIPALGGGIGGIIMGTLVGWLRVRVVVTHVQKYHEVPFIGRRINIKTRISSPWHIASLGVVFILVVFLIMLMNFGQQNVMGFRFSWAQVVFRNTFCIGFFLIFSFVHWRWFTQVQKELKVKQLQNADTKNIVIK